jgi:polysaccharide biosynthesis transport protein
LSVKHSSIAEALVICPGSIAMEFNPRPEEIDFSQYWLTLKRHWLAGGSLFALSLVASGAIAVLEKPLYKAEGKLLFRKRDTASSLLGGTQQKVGELESLNQQNTPIDTEAEVLRSLPLIEKTIRDLKLKDPSGQPVVPEDFSKSLTIKAAKGTDVLLVSYQDDHAKQAAAVVNHLLQTYLANNLRLNRMEAVSARNYIIQQLPTTEVQLRKAETALRKFEEQNQIVSLPEETQSLVATHAELARQIATAEAALGNAIAQSQALQQRIGLGANQAHTLNSLAQSSSVQTLLTQIQQTQAELAMQRLRFQAKHPAILNLQERKQTLQALLKEQIAQTLKSSQSQPQRNLQLGDSDQKLIDTLINTEISRLGLVRQVTTLQQTQANSQNRANRIPSLKQRQQELLRQVETAKLNYETLMKRLQEIQIAENQTVGNARIVAAASVPTIAISSKRKLILAGGAIAGGLLYVVAAFVAELRDPSLKTTKQVRERFPYPWVGLIPLLKQHKFKSPGQPEATIPELPVRDAPQSLASEAYRMLQSNLRFLNPDQTVQTIVVTSSVSKEGKSTVSANLALALAQIGHKVLLVDADLHHPVQHHIWQLTNEVGLSNVIMNHAQFSHAIQVVQHNLNVLTSGVIPPNPLTLIDSKRMAILTQEFSQQYDFVIFDAPPLVLVSDVIPLSQNTDGVLLVARPGVIDASSAETTKALLSQSGLKVLGVVTNGVMAENEPDRYLHRAKAYYENATPELSSHRLS